MKKKKKKLKSSIQQKKKQQQNMRDFIYWRRRIENVFFFIPTNSKRNHTEFELSFTIDCMRDDSCLNSIKEKIKKKLQQ